jgi:hypothetical protein
MRKWLFVNFGESLLFRVVLADGTISISPRWIGFDSLWQEYTLMDDFI